MAYELSAPSKSGFREQYEDVEAIREKAANLLDCAQADLVEVESGDGDITYCYASQAAADADPDGAFAVQYREVR